MAADKTSKSQEKRKSSKPLMEKKRRARINECLSELQGILEVVNNGHAETTGGHSKREKSEILEQTVQLVQHLRHQDQIGIPSEPLPRAQAQYRAGFNECLSQVSRFMEVNNSALTAETRSGLLNHLAGTLRSSTSYNGYTGQFGPGASKAVPQEMSINHRPVLGRRGCTPVAPTVPVQSQHSLATPPKLSVPPLAPAPSPTTPSKSSQVSNNAIPIQQSPSKGEQPAAACIPPLPPAALGITLPVNIPSAPIGHVALVLPAHLLSSLVGGQFTTGQVIPLFQHQGGSPVICQQGVPSSGTSMTLGPNPPPNGVVRALPSPASAQGSNPDSRCANTFSSLGTGQIFIIPSPSAGCSANMAPASEVLDSSSSLSTNIREGIPLPNPPNAPLSLVAMETRNQNGVVYAPMHLCVSPAAYSGGVNGSFTNGVPLPNSPSLALGPHWRPWGWEQDQR